MLAVLLCNQPYTLPSNGYEDHYKRRPNEKVIWHDDWIKAQEELTEFKALPEQEQEIVAQQAIKAVKASVSDDETVLDAKEALGAYDTASDMLLQLEELNILIIAYFMIQFQKKREDEIATLLMLGVL